MADIATLGLAIDSRQAVTAGKDLDGMSAAAKRAETSIAGLQSKAGPGLGAIEAMARRAGVSVEEMQRRIAAAPQNIAKAYQTATPVIARNTTELVKASDSLAESHSKTERSSSSLANTLTRRFILGYAVSQVRGLATAVAGLNSELARAGDIGRVTDGGSAQTQGIISSAGSKGIDGATMSSAMLAFNAQIPLAKAGVGELGQLLRANGVIVQDTSDAFFKVADLVKNAANDTARLSILQQAGLPATLEMLRFMRQGSEVLKEQAAQVTTANEAQVAAAQRIRDKWAESWQSFRDKGTVAIAEVIGFFDRLDGAATRFLMKIPFIGASVPTNMLKSGFAGAIDGSRLSQGQANSFYDAVGFGRGGTQGGASGSGTGGNTRDLATEKAIAQDHIAKAQQLLGLYGQTTTALEARRMVELQLQSAALNGVAIDKTRADTLKRLAEEQNLGITAIKASTDAQKIEAATIGMSVGQAQAYTAAQSLLAEAKRSGKALTEENIAAIQREAEALGAAAQRADEARFQFDTFSGTFREFGANLRNGQSAWEAFGNAGRNALGKIADRLMDMATRQLWNAAFPTGGGGIFSLFGLGGGAGNIGGTGGILGGLYHSGHGPGDPTRETRLVPASIFRDAPRFHTGIGPGERAAVIRNDESVLTPGQMRQLSPNGGAKISIVNNNDFRGADPGSEARLRRYVDDSSARAVKQAVEAVSDVFSKTPDYLKARK